MFCKFLGMFGRSKDGREGGAGRAIALPLFAWVKFFRAPDDWIFYEFYHLKAIQRVYPCIYTKSKAQQSCAGTVFFAGVLTVPTVLPKITLEGCIMRPSILSSVLLTSALTRKASTPTPRWRLSWLKLLIGSRI